MKANEQQILRIIKYAPSVFILFLSISITLFFYFERKNAFLKEKDSIQNNYIIEKKILIHEEVYRVYNFIKQLQKTTEIELKESIKNRVYEAYAIATAIYNKYKNQKSKEEIFEIIKISLNDMRYNDGRGYIFIDSNKGDKLLQPPSKEMEGQNFYNFEDLKGNKFMHDIVKIIDNKTEDFIQYYWKSPNSKEDGSKKISFIKYFEPYNVAIGSGEYVEDFEKQIQRKALDYIKLVQFGKDGYIFIINYDGIYLNHIRKEFIGQNAITNNDIVNIKEVIENLISISKNGEGYYSYIQNKKPDTNLPTQKVSFVKGLNKWGWIIGTGFYQDEINETLKQREEELNRRFDSYVKNIFIISLFLTFILLLISIYISKFLENKFNAYKKELKNKQNILYQQSKMASMGEMIGNIAHQWRQPLSTITAAATGTLLSKELGVLEDIILEDSLKRINKSAQYLSKTIDDFRNFFNPQKVKNEFLLADTFSNTLELISAQFNSQNITILRDIEEMKINTYENELIQVLINILNNARDELKDKKLTKKLIFINAYKDERNAIITIKDNAGGIPTENINKIFEPYFTTKYKSQGTGIGLYMSEEIIVRHIKGKIEVENVDFIFEEKKYTGALFKIKIPFLDISNEE